MEENTNIAKRFEKSLSLSMITPFSIPIPGLFGGSR